MKLISWRHVKLRRNSDIFKIVLPFKETEAVLIRERINIAECMKNMNSKATITITPRPQIKTIHQIRTLSLKLNNLQKKQCRINVLAYTLFIFRITSSIRTTFIGAHL